MEKTPNKLIAVAYKLYAESEGNKVLVEEATDEKPFVFLSGMGITLPAFENAVAALAVEEKFNFSLSPADAYGEFVPERVLDLDKNIFFVDGHFDDKHIFKDAIVPLQNEDGNRFMGHVLDITATEVRIDLNHPLAGKELTFEGYVIENREATKEELQQYVDSMNGGCGGGCESCESGCGGHKDGECGCGGHEGGNCNCGKN